MTQKSGPFAAGAGANLGQDDYLDTLGPMLQGDGVNTTVLGGTSCQVYGASAGLQVFVRAGSALVRGAMWSNTADVSLTIAANGTGSARIDRVVLRNDRGHSGGGQIAPVVITGTPSATPVAPAYQQTPGGVWDIPLAQVRVAAATSGITAGDVSDERLYLPLHIGVCDTSLPLFTPPVDGSAGRVFYDKNPAVLDLIVTNGAAWRQRWLGNSGWQGVTVPYFGGGSYLEFQIINGNQVWWRGFASKTASDPASPDLGVVSTNLFPSGHTTRLVFPLAASNLLTGLAYEGGWWIQGTNEGPDVRFSVINEDGRDPMNHFFFIDFSYLLG